MKVARTTLRKWATSSHVERYEKIRREVIPQIHDRMAQESEDLAGEYAVVERKVLERVEEELPNLKAGEAAGAARNLATSRAISADKALLLRGRPTEITEHRNPDELLRKLASSSVVDVVDGTATELPPSPALPPASSAE